MQDGCIQLPKRGMVPGVMGGLKGRDGECLIWVYVVLEGRLFGLVGRLLMVDHSLLVSTNEKRCTWQ